MTKSIETDVGNALKRVKTALESLRTTGANLDSRINEIRQTVSRLQQDPISLDDFGVFLRACIVKKGQAWLNSAPATAFVGPSFLGEMANLHQQPWEVFENGALPHHSLLRKLLGGDISGAAIFAVFPDQVCAVILENFKKEVGTVWGNNDAVPVAERRAMIALLNEERTGLEEQRKALQNEIDAMVEVIS